MNSLMAQYNLHDYYRDLDNVRKPVFVLDELIKLFFPKVGKHFVRNSAFHFFIIHRRTKV